MDSELQFTALRVLLVVIPALATAEAEAHIEYARVNSRLLKDCSELPSNGTRCNRFIKGTKAWSLLPTAFWFFQDRPLNSLIGHRLTFQGEKARKTLQLACQRAAVTLSE